MRVFPLVALATLLAPAAKRADAQHASTLVVDVADEESGTPLVGAQVRVPELGRFARAKTMGVATLPRIPEGVYHVEARFLGYEPTTAPVLFRGDDTVEVVLLMRRATQAMDTVRVHADRVAARLEQFEFRHKLGFGHFLTQAQLDRDAGRQLANVLSSRLPGVQIVWDVVANKNVVTSARGATDLTDKPCPVVIVIDGIPTIDPDIDAIRPSDLAGVEFYDAANVPAELRVNAAPMSGAGGAAHGANAVCGVLALWTR